MKNIILLSISLLYSLLTFSQGKAIIDTTLFCREIFSYGDSEYILADKKSKAFLLKTTNNTVVDTIITFKADPAVTGFNNLFINKERIYIRFDGMTKLTINDSISFVSPKLIYNVICFDMNGKLIWRNYFQPEESIYGVKNLFITSGCINKIKLGFNVGTKLIVDKDTIGSEYFDNRAVIIVLNRKGHFTKVVDYSAYFKSSMFYKYNRYGFKNTGLMLNSWDNKSSAKKIYNTSSCRPKIYFDNDSLQITDFYVFKNQLYVLTKEGYLIKYIGKRASGSIKLVSSFIPEESKKATISQKSVFDNGEYLTYVCAYEIRDKNKKWSDWGSLEKIYVDIQHFNKENMKLYKKENAEIFNLKNWATITSCRENELKINKDGKYFIQKNNYAQ
jgi:hypothetical protein